MNDTNPDQPSRSAVTPPVEAPSGDAWCDCGHPLKAHTSDGGPELACFYGYDWSGRLCACENFTPIVPLPPCIDCGHEQVDHGLVAPRPCQVAGCYCRHLLRQPAPAAPVGDPAPTATLAEVSFAVGERVCDTGDLSLGTIKSVRWDGDALFAVDMSVLWDDGSTSNLLPPFDGIAPAPGGRGPVPVTEEDDRPTGV